jgi:cytochrome c oxidase assembly protein Cox11
MMPSFDHAPCRCSEWVVDVLVVLVLVVAVMVIVRPAALPLLELTTLRLGLGNVTARNTNTRQPLLAPL